MANLQLKKLNNNNTGFGNAKETCSYMDKFTATGVTSLQNISHAVGTTSKTVREIKVLKRKYSRLHKLYSD